MNGRHAVSPGRVVIVSACLSVALAGYALPGAPDAVVAENATVPAGPMEREGPEGPGHVGSGAVVDHEHVDLEATPAAVPMWDAVSETAAVRVATQAVTAFGADLDPDTWWGGVAPLLTPSAQAAYVGTDPRNIPIGTVSGALPSTERPVSAFVVQVGVGTDVGVYAVLLSRTGAGEPWLVERIVPPLAGEPQP